LKKFPKNGKQIAKVLETIKLCKTLMHIRCKHVLMSELTQGLKRTSPFFIYQVAKDEWVIKVS
jgi:hypothetical protein